MRKLLLAVGALVVAMVAVLALRALFVSTPQPPPLLIPTFLPDRAGAVSRLSRAIQWRTVSDASASSEFAGFAAWLPEAFPRTHQTLMREVVGGGALLYTWPGKRPDLPALLLLAHIDVVPVDPASESQWTHPPFGGVVAEDFIWGRGSLDDKGAVLAILEAVESLVATGFQPEQTVLLAFGHDEERGGAEGAQQIAALLQSRAVKVDAVLDEGGVIATGIVPGTAATIALVGIAEKGFATVELTSEGEGGHASMPPPMTPVGRIARAVQRIQANPFPAHLRGATRRMFDTLAPEMNPVLRTLSSNLWLFAPLIEQQAGQSPSLNASLRTTVAPTMISGGVRDNVIPSSAQAVLNVRILPGDSVAGVMKYLREAVDDPAVRLSIRGEASEPSAVSEVSAPQFQRLSQTLRAVFPNVVVSPYLLVAATDARHYDKLTANIYRFLPVRFEAADLQRMHGVDERIAIRDHMHSIRFYRALIERWARP